MTRRQDLRFPAAAARRPKGVHADSTDKNATTYMRPRYEPRSDAEIFRTLRIIRGLKAGFARPWLHEQETPLFCAATTTNGSKS